MAITKNFRPYILGGQELIYDLNNKTAWIVLFYIEK